MIKAIQKIGEYVAGKEVNQEKFLKNICLHIEPTREIKQKDKPPKKVKQHIVFVNFVTDKPKSKIKISYKEINLHQIKTGIEYLWIGDTIRHKLYCPITTTKFENLLENTIYDLYKNKGISEKNFKLISNRFFNDGKIYFSMFDFYSEMIENKKSKITNMIEKLKQIKTQKEKKEILKEVKEIWNKTSIQKIPISEKESPENIITALNLLNENLKDNLKERYKKIDNIIEDVFIYGLKKNLHYEKKMRTKSNEVALYTLLLNGKSLTQTDEYKKFIYEEKIENLLINSGRYKSNYSEKNYCSICQSETKTTSSVANLQFKFYMNDKLGFASNLDGHFKNNYNICKNCYQHLMIAERYIKEKLKSKIGGMDVYILPKFLLSVDDFNIDDFAKFINFKNQQISDIKRAEETLEDELEMFEKYNNKYLLNYLFYKSSGKSSEFKIYKLIKDIPPSRINFIKRKEQDISNLIDDKFDGNYSYKIDLNRIWGCIPVKIQKDSKHGYSKYLDVIDNIFSNRKIDYDFLINQVIETLHIIKYETPKYNIRNKEDIVNKIINLNFLFLFLKKLNILGGVKMDKQRNKHFTDEMIPNDISDYWENLKIYQDNQKKGLFLLGYLIGEVGSKQSSQQIKNKPILNKLNFQGIGTEKLNRLSSDVLEKLKQYKLLDFKENVYSASHLLIEENIENWSLSNQENVFYILSGFAFSNYLIRKRSKEKYSEELQEKIQLIENMKSEGKNVEEFVNILSKAKLLGTEEHKYSEARKLLKEIKKQEEK